MKAKLTLIPAVAVAAVAMTTATASARDNDRMVEYAHEIEDIAEELEDEFKTHFRHSGAYRHLMGDIARILDEAEHIDELAHDRHVSLRHLKADVADLDRLAHHLHDVVDAAERGRYSGHVDGDTRHVHSMLRDLNSTIHNMERYIEALARPRYPSCGYDRRSVSYSTRGGNFGITFVSHGRH